MNEDVSNPSVNYTTLPEFDTTLTKPTMAAILTCFFKSVVRAQRNEGRKDLFFTSLSRASKGHIATRYKLRIGKIFLSLYEWFQLPLSCRNATISHPQRRTFIATRPTR